MLVGIITGEFIMLVRNYRTLRRTLHDWNLPQHELEKVIHKRLRGVLISAYLNVPFYHAMMKQKGYNPIKDFQGESDLQFLAIIQKNDFKNRDINEFIIKGVNYQKFFTDSTSGSTGIPIKVYRNRNERAVQIAKWLRFLFINGYKPTQKVMSITSPARLNEGKSFIQFFGLFRRLAIDYLAEIDFIADKFIEYKPDVLYANRSHLEMLASELDGRNAKFHNLKLLLTGAEILTTTHKKQLKQSFGVDLLEFYGSVEGGVMAIETQERDGLHLYEDLTFFEFLTADDKPAKAGEPARLVFTDLTGKVMPFIRYEQGDQVIFDYAKPEDENSPKRLRRIIGRNDDYYILKDGKKRPFHYFYEIMDKFLEIKQFRVIQDSYESFTIYILASESYFEEIEKTLSQNVKEKLPGDIIVRLIRIDKMDPDPEGKLRMLKSYVK